jgi:hypothetical protein
MKKSIFTVILLVLLLALFSGPASASQSVASANWTDLSSIYGASGGTTTIGSNTYYTGLGVGSTTTDTTTVNINATYASANTNYTSNLALYSTGNFPDFISQSTSTGATAFDVLNTANLRSKSITGPNGVNGPVGTASTEIQINYTYNGPSGDVYVKLPYIVNVSLVSTGPSSEAHGYGEAYYSFTINGVPQDSQSLHAGSIVANGGTFHPGVYTFNQEKTLGLGLNIGFYDLTLSLNNGDKGQIILGTYAESSATAVPIPGAVWLLGSGLVGLIGIRRRRDE